jgi:hypothetical protein
MITNPPAENESEKQPVVAEPGFEVAAQAFWEKNRGLILGLCAVALLAIIGYRGWEYFAAQHEESVRADFAKAGDRPEQLSTFAAANSGHVLAGVAYLRVADVKYAAADYRAALENYNKAATSLTVPALSGRARVGAAMSQLYSNDKAAGEASLKAIGNDATLLNGVRAEADYHLATLAYEAGNATELARLVGEINKLDAGGLWAERAAALQVTK